MRGGQADEEANNLYTEAITVHNDELCPMATKFEAAVLELVQAKSRQSGSSNQAQPPNLGKLKVNQRNLFMIYHCFNIFFLDHAQHRASH